MKTLQELYKEVIASDELKQEFMEAAKDKENGQKNVEEFLKKHECDATFDELKTFLVDKSDEELDEDDELPQEEQVSAAIGYALYDPKVDKTVDDVFKRADEAMYKRKRSMKNHKQDAK